MQDEDALESEVEDSNLNQTSSAPTSVGGVTNLTKQTGSEIDKHPVVARVLTHRENWKAYQYGNYKVFCSGKIIIGPVRYLWWLLEALSIIVFVVFAWESCTYPNKFHSAIQYTGITVFVILMLSSFRTLFGDPGIHPKPDYETALTNAREAVTEGIMSPKQYVIDNRVAPHRYCYVCNHYRAPGTQHCTVCNACIKHIDHHCPVYGGCVGQTNYYVFEAMCFSLVGFLLLMLVSGIVAFSKEIGQPGMDVDTKFLLSACYTFDVIVLGLLLELLMCPFVNGPRTASDDYSRPRSVLRPLPLPKQNDYNRVHPASEEELKAARMMQLMSGDHQSSNHV